MDETFLDSNSNVTNSGAFSALIETALRAWSEHVVAGSILCIAAIGLLLAAIVFTNRVLRKRFGDPTFPNPERLFRELARLHRLSGEETRLLKRLALQREARCEAELFVRPDWFTLEGSPDHATGDSERIIALKRKLFG